jgi:hypothetical protein
MATSAIIAASRFMVSPLALADSIAYIHIRHGGAGIFSKFGKPRFSCLTHRSLL